MTHLPGTWWLLLRDCTIERDEFVDLKTRNQKNHRQISQANIIGRHTPTGLCIKRTWCSERCLVLTGIVTPSITARTVSPLGFK